MRANINRYTCLKFALSFLLILFFLELVSVCYLGVTKAKFSYGRRDASGDASLQLNKNPKQILHPYFGYTRPPELPIGRILKNDRKQRFLSESKTLPNWINFSANNMGFFSEKDYPYQKKVENELIVGIFGGSVAQWFALLAEERFIDLIVQNPSYQNTKFTILNCSQGGYKQPQQLLTYTYLLTCGQKFDIVINISGFNELALGGRNVASNNQVSLPHHGHLHAILNALVKSEGNTRIPTRLKLSEKLEDRSLKTRSAFFHLFYSKLHQYHHNKYLKEAEEEEISFDRSTYNNYYYAPQMNNIEKPNLDRSLFEPWKNASLIMEQQSSLNESLYIEIVQPNQYYSKKAFSDAERKIAFKKNHPYRKYIETHYPKLKKFLKNLSDSGVNIHDATHIFDDVPGTIYVDDCCHYNETGNFKLAEFMVEKIIENAPK